MDWQRLANWLVPKALRQPLFMTMVRAVLHGHSDVYNRFLRYRQAKIYQVTITGQVCYLERMLNDRWDFTQRRIRIDDAVWHLPWFIYQEAELKPQYLFRKSEDRPQYLYRNGEAGDGKDDFVVLVPMDIGFSEPEMRAAIDSYKLFGTKYTIQRV